MVSLSAMVLLTACASPTTRTSPAERLEFYRAHAGEPVRSFNSPGRIWGWRSLGDSALAVWPSSNRGFLLELQHRCPDMVFATSIGLTTRTGRVSAGFDSVVVQRGGNQGQTSCRIATIRPLNTRTVKEPKSELHDADLLQREAPEPGEPTEPEQPQ
jgi:hypothetical protein